MIRSRNIDPKGAARYNVYEGIWEFSASTTKTGLPLGASWVPAGEKIKDIVITQQVAGGGGTSLTFAVLKNGTTVCSTEGILARTAGDNASVDAAGTISLPSGSTRPVLKTDSTVTLAKGDDLALNVTVSGTYSTTFPKVSVAVVTEPLA